MALNPKTARASIHSFRLFQFLHFYIHRAECGEEAKRCRGLPPGAVAHLVHKQPVQRFCLFVSLVATENPPVLMHRCDCDIMLVPKNAPKLADDSLVKLVYRLIVMLLSVEDGLVVQDSQQELILGGVIFIERFNGSESCFLGVFRPLSALQHSNAPAADGVAKLATADAAVNGAARHHGQLQTVTRGTFAPGGTSQMRLYGSRCIKRIVTRCRFRTTKASSG